MQRSIALNDNRAIFRSRLLLDEDLAVRSAGLGGIYRNLGFERLALIEGYQAIAQIRAATPAIDYSRTTTIACRYTRPRA